MFRTNDIELTSYTTISKDPIWVSSMNTNIDALNANHALEFTPLLEGPTSIGSKGNLKIKRYEDGTIYLYKVGLVTC